MHLDITFSSSYRNSSLLFSILIYRKLFNNFPKPKPFTIIQRSMHLSQSKKKRFNKIWKSMQGLQFFNLLNSTIKLLNNYKSKNLFEFKNALVLSSANCASTDLTTFPPLLIDTL